MDVDTWVFQVIYLFYAFGSFALSIKLFNFLFKYRNLIIFRVQTFHFFILRPGNKIKALLGLAKNE